MDDRTVTTVKPLTPKQRIAEVARMIGGAEVTETVLQHAREMLSHAEPASAKSKRS